MPKKPKQLKSTKNLSTLQLALNEKVCCYARMWPREIFHHEIPKKKGGRKAQMLCDDPDVCKLLDGPGVYVLYRDNVPYYIGQSKSGVVGRLRDHATTAGFRHYNFWNFFSAFILKEKDDVDWAEAILIAAMPPTVNAQKTLNRIEMPKKVKHLLAELRHMHANPRDVNWRPGSL